MKKNKFIVLALSVLIAGTILFTNENLFKADEADQTVIVNGVYIGGIDVSGMNAQQATDAVNTYIEQLKATSLILKGPKSDLELTYGDLGLTSKVESAVAEAVTVAQSGSLIQRFMNLKDLEKENVVIDMGLSIDKQQVGKLLYDKADKLNVVALDNSIIRQNGKFEYIVGQTGNEIDIVPSVNKLSEIVSNDCEIAIPKENVYELASNVVEARGSEAEFASVKDLLGSFSTDFSTSGEGRKINVINGCSKVNGTVLFPGDEISLHDITGPYTRENGYREAGTFSNGTVIESFGGGICQVTTTVYQAALYAELDITARSNHSMVVTYCDIAGDAAIAGTYKDLKIRNNKETPIYIEGYCKNGIITFNIYGKETRPANRELSFETEILSKTLPDTEYVLRQDYPKGYFEIGHIEYIGYSAKYWKVIKVDGVETGREQVNKSWYRASGGKYYIGVAGATEEEIAAINAATATKDIDIVKDLLKEMAKQPTPENPEGTDTTPGTGETPNTGENGGENTGSNNGGNTGVTPENPTTPDAGEEGNDDGAGNGSGTGTGTGETTTPEEGTGETQNPTGEGAGESQNPTGENPN